VLARPGGRAEITEHGALRLEVAVHLTVDSTLGQMKRIGEWTTVTCPDCGGRLWRKGEGDYSHYMCELGHAYSEQSLLDGMDWQVERLLWVALRMLERMAREAEGNGRLREAVQWRERAAESYEDAENVRRFLLREVETE
jgi:two-component system, chemotaxis family, protein-glutamate methylesterase/glutaminase